MTERADQATARLAALRDARDLEDALHELVLRINSLERRNGLFFDPHDERHAERHEVLPDSTRRPDALIGLLDANARVIVRNNAGVDFGPRRRVHFIQGANMTITVADVPNLVGYDEEVSVTLASAGGAGHAQSHVLATGTALGPDHTMSGANAGEVLRALSATAAAFDVLAHGDLGSVTADQHHAQAHTVSDHTTAVNISDEGIAKGAVHTLDFVGAGVSAAVAAGVATVTISAAGGYATVQDEGTPLTQRTTMNFVGAGVSAADAGGVTVVTITGGGAGNVATDIIWDAAGDLAVGTGPNAAARLGIGANNSVLAVVAGAVVWDASPLVDWLQVGDTYFRLSLGVITQIAKLDFYSFIDATLSFDRAAADWSFSYANITDMKLLGDEGQLQLPITGEAAGLRIGGDTQLYRSAANIMTLAAGDALDILGGAGDFGTPVNGIIWYNTTTNKFRGYENGAWANMSGGAQEFFSAVAVQTLAAGDAITVTDGSPDRLISSASAITLTSQPTIAAGRNGQVVYLHNVGSFNITLQDVNALGGALLRFTANTLAINPGGTMGLLYDSTLGFWCEISLVNPQTFTPSIATFTVDGYSAVNHEVGGASSLEDTSPANHTAFALTYVGTPSACVIDIDGGEINPADYPVTVLTPFLQFLLAPNWYRGTTIGSTRIFTATATVAGQAGKTKTVTITYINRRYMGPNAQGTQLSSAQILALDGAGGTSDLSTIRTGSFVVTIGAGVYCWYAYRSALGAALYFAIGGEWAGFNDLLTMSHTNDSGFAETFQQYRSVNQNLGAVTVVAQTAQPNNRLYIGPHTATAITDAQILTLDDTADGESVVDSTIAGTYTAIRTPAGSGKYLWVCHPDRIPDIVSIKDDSMGFAIGGSYIGTTVSHTNQYGAVENYRTWRSTNAEVLDHAPNVTIT